MLHESDKLDRAMENLNAVANEWNPQDRTHWGDEHFRLRCIELAMFHLSNIYDMPDDFISAADKLHQWIKNGNADAAQSQQ